MADSPWRDLCAVAEELDGKYLAIVFDELGCEYDTDPRRKRFRTGRKVVEGIVLMA